MSLEISYMPQWEKLIELEPVVALQSEQNTGFQNQPIWKSNNYKRSLTGEFSQSDTPIERQFGPLSTRNDDLETQNRNSTTLKNEDDSLRRVDKQAKYAPIITVLMNLLKEYSLFKLSKEISKKFRIKQQKSYEAIALRFGLLLNHLMTVKKHPKQKALDIIFGKFYSNLKDCIQKKYGKTNTQVFIQTTNQRCLKGVGVFYSALKCSFEDESTIQDRLKDLYSFTMKGQTSMKNMKYVIKIMRIMKEASKNGPKFNLNKDDIQKECSLLTSLKQNKIQLSSLDSEFFGNSIPYMVFQTFNSISDLTNLVLEQQIQQFRQNKMDAQLKDLMLYQNSQIQGNYEFIHLY